MSGERVRLAGLIAGLVVAGGTVGPAAATDHSDDQLEPCDHCIEDPENGESEVTGGFGGAAFNGNTEAAANVRRAYLRAKKAFHEARQNLQDIEKGEEPPVENVPTFFEDDNGDD